MADKGFVLPNYDQELATCERFLRDFRDYDQGMGQDPKYLEQLQRIANRQQDSLDIELDDVKAVRATPTPPHPLLSFCMFPVTPASHSLSLSLLNSSSRATWASSAT
jgi:hypothetical protein